MAYPARRQGLTKRRRAIRRISIGIFIGAIILSGFYLGYQRFFSPPPPPLQVTIHTSASIMEAANATQPQQAVANCPKGTTALSGGYSITDTATPTGAYFAQASYPTITTSAGAPTSGWTVTYMNASNDAQTFQAVVLCLTKIMPTVRIESEAVGANGQGIATCPSGMQAISGGFNFNDPIITASVSAPVNPQPGVVPTAWTVQTNGAQAGDQQIVYAVCVSGLHHIALGNPSTISVNVDTPMTVQSSCANGVLVSAGYSLRDTDGVGSVYIIRTAPAGSGWQVLLQNLDGTNQGGDLWPICAS
jgi:hypothetical protein